MKLNIFRIGKSRGREPSLRAQAIELEHQAEILLNQHREILDAHDESAPFDGNEIGFGRGATAARIALNEGRAVQRLLNIGGVEDVARRRLNRGKKAYKFASGIVEEYGHSLSFETRASDISQSA